MTREQILTKTRESETAIRAEGLLHLAVYGSRPRGERPHRHRCSAAAIGAVARKPE